MTFRTRVGLGTDRHRLRTGRPLILGGVRIPSEVGPVGHSDADVVFHSLADGVLGALALGDIGELFPDTDPENSGLDSAKIVARAVDMIREKGHRVANCDIVVHLESPKLLPYRQEIRESVARALGIDLGSVSLKAKTGEGIGVVGEGLAIEAMAVVLVAQVTTEGTEE